MEYVYLSISWIFYYTMHSILATDYIKKKVSTLLPNQNLWRIVYSVFSIIGLLALLIQMASIQENTLWQESTLVKLTSLISITYGLIIIKLSFKNQSILSFLTIEERFNSNEPLNTTGIYAKVRHPLYSGTLLIFIGLFFLFSTLLYDLYLGSCNTAYKV
ncbi:MAG: NnrU family protein [Bacteroidota bacterium]